MTEGDHTPTVLLIEDQEWTARSIESILRPSGLAVVKTYTGRQGMQLAGQVQPDLVIADLHLPDMTGVDVIRDMTRTGTLSPSTPVVMISSSHIAQSERILALEVGAWDVLQPPFDSVELTLRIRTWLRAKRDSDMARERGLVDERTGVYNFNGVLRRVDEILAEAGRHERHVSCLVIGPAASQQEESSQAPSTEVEGGVLLQVLSEAVTRSCRLSDAVGRIGGTEFVVVAPATDREGAARLAERILDSARQTDPERSTLRAGIYSVKRTPRDPSGSVDVLSRATNALRRAQARNGGSDPVVFDTLEN